MSPGHKFIVVVFFTITRSWSAIGGKIRLSIPEVVVGVVNTEDSLSPSTGSSKDILFWSCVCIGAFILTVIGMIILYSCLKRKLRNQQTLNKRFNPKSGTEVESRQLFEIRNEENEMVSIVRRSTDGNYTLKGHCKQSEESGQVLPYRIRPIDP